MSFVDGLKNVGNFIHNTLTLLKDFLSYVIDGTKANIQANAEAAIQWFFFMFFEF